MPGRVRDGAEREVDLRRVEVERALDARRLARRDDPRVALEQARLPLYSRNIDILNQEEQSRNLSDTIGHYGPLSLTLGWKGILFSDIFGLICCILGNYVQNFGDEVA